MQQNTRDRREDSHSTQSRLSRRRGSPPVKEEGKESEESGREFTMKR
jgi:hypothetical protein